MVEVMQDRGVSTRKMEGYAQRLRRGEGGTGADLVRPRLLDFWQVRLHWFSYRDCGGEKKEYVVCVPTGRITTSVP